MDTPSGPAGRGGAPSPGRSGTHAPAPAPGALTPYAADRHAWAREQAALLRAGRLGEVDAANVAEVLREAELAEYDKLEDALRVLLSHMLGWDHQPGGRSRRWAATIAIQRNAVAKVLRKNPSLEAFLDEAIAEAWDYARSDASSQTDLPFSTFPEAIPYDWAAITERPFDFDPPAPPRPRGGRTR